MVLRRSHICFYGCALTLMATAALAHQAQPFLYCCTMVSWFFTFLSLMPSDREVPTILMWGFRCCCATSTIEVLKMIRRVQSERLRLDLLIATGSHVLNLVVCLFGLMVLSRMPHLLWRGGRVYATFLGVNCLTSLAISWQSGGTSFAAPGGTSDDPCSPIFCSLLSIFFALASGPSNRKQLLEVWTAVPLSSIPFDGKMGLSSFQDDPFDIVQRCCSPVACGNWSAPLCSWLFGAAPAATCVLSTATRVPSTRWDHIDTLSSVGSQSAPEGLNGAPSNSGVSNSSTEGYTNSAASTYLMEDDTANLPLNTANANPEFQGLY